MLVLLAGVVLCRTYWVGQQTAYAASAGGQSVQTLALPRARGDFYDRTGRRLTGLSPRYYALCLPGDAGYTALFPYVPYAEQSLLYERRNLASPFLIQVDRDLTAQGITTCTVPQHFGGSTAAHLLGYLDSEGRGVSGLEKAYDDLLTASGDTRTVTCFMTAQGRLLTDTSPLVAVETPGTGQGVRLTLDADLQRACEGLATVYLPRGCIVVMDTATGEVLASVSMPPFDPQNVAASIAANDTSLLNRPLRAFSAGAVFIELGRLLGAQRIRKMAEALGFGTATQLAPGLQGASGTLPDAAALENPGELATFSFGQGALTVTPLQITAMMNTVANGGMYRTPAFVQGMVDADGTLTGQTRAADTRTVFDAATARVLRSMLASVVSEGIGSEAQPKTGTAGGKTGTAQTGQYDENGEELLNYWFSGFYPADDPRYTITVLQDGILKPEASSAAIFAKVTEILAVWENS